MACSGELEVASARHRRRHAPAVLGWNERVVGAVHDERRHLDQFQRRDPGCGGEDRDELPPEPERVIGPVIEALDLGPLRLGVERVLHAGEHASRLDAEGDPLLARRTRRAHEKRASFRSRRDRVVSARPRHDRGQRERVIRVLDRDQLCDEPAHRRADDVRRRDVERRQARTGLGEQRVRRLRVARVRRGNVGRACGLHPGREAGVAIVVADDVEAAFDELVDEAFIPCDELGAETHDQQQRLVFWVAVDLVLDLETVGLQSRHRLQS